MCSGIVVDDNGERINLSDEIRKMFTDANELSDDNNLKNDESNDYSC